MNGALVPLSVCPHFFPTESKIIMFSRRIPNGKGVGEMKTLNWNQQDHFLQLPVQRGKGGILVLVGKKSGWRRWIGLGCTWYSSEVTRPAKVIRFENR